MYSPLDPQLLGPQGALSLVGQPSMFVCNTIVGPWPNTQLPTVTPLPIKPLTVSLQATPATLPMLPLLSPGATPCLGIGVGSLASRATGQSLEQVVSVATDPMSRHYIHLNMIDVDLDHDAMDALMEVERGTPLARRLAQQPGLGLAGPPPVCAGMLSPWPQLQLIPIPGDDDSPAPHDVGAHQAHPPHPRWRPSSAASSDTLATSPSSSRPSPSEQLSDSTQTLAHRATACKNIGMDLVGARFATSSARRMSMSGTEGGEPSAMGLSVSFLDENGYFDMTLKDAADQLGVGVTTLKKLCRQSGLGRWPYRARCSLKNLRDKMREYFACAPEDERDAADALMEREFCRLARMNVGAIDDAFKQFRQAMFKLEFKARQQLDVGRGGGGSGGRKRAHPSTHEGDLNAVFHGDAAFRQQAMLHLRRLLNACSEGSA